MQSQMYNQLQRKFQPTEKLLYSCQNKDHPHFMPTQANIQKQHTLRKTKGLQVVSNIKPFPNDQSISSPTIKQPNLQHSQQKYKPKDNAQNQESQTMDRNYSFIIDYQNARYHGKISSSSSKGKKLIKSGPGILIDDDINFIFSNWKNNLPDGKTVLIDRLGNYFYSKLKAPTGNPAGLAIIRVGTVLIMTKFSQKTGVWSMTQTDQENIIIAVDEKALCLVVLKGTIQSLSGQFKPLKSSPLSVVEFAHFGNSFSDEITKNQTHDFKSSTSRKSKSRQNIQKPKIQDILLTYAQKYGFKIQNCEVSISDFMQSIAHSVKKECYNSKQFSYEVTRSLLNQVFNQQSNDKKATKQNYESYEKQKQKVYDKNYILFTECSSNSSKIKETSFYFGFSNGLGIKFKDQQSYQDRVNGLQRVKSFRAKSIGIHNELMKVEEIGARFYDNNCIEEGNFKSKNTCTYENALFRPTNKLISIYNKYHKQQTTFLNEYFDRNQIQIFKLLTSFEHFVNEHIVYILNECLIQTTKFNEKSQKDQLVEKVLLKNYKKSNPISTTIHESKLRGPSYQLQVERKGKDKSNVQDNNNQALNELKEKKSQLKQKIKKVKYQIQYLPQNDNFVVMTDDKFMSKIKKHLTTHRNQTDDGKHKGSKIQGKSLSDRSRAKSVVVSRSKSRTTYIQKDKPKVASPTENKRSSPTKNKMSSPTKNKRSSATKQVQTSAIQKSFNDQLKKLANQPDKIQELTKTKNPLKTQAQLMLDRINHSIEFRQKFNYGIEFNVENDFRQKKSRKREQSPSKNRYNGRNRFFTDNQLDSAVDHHLSTSSQVSVKTITPGKKNKRKEQSRHMIYSNVKRNHNHQQQKYDQQKQTEQAIRAEILGLSLQQYKNQIEYQKQQHTFMQQNFLKLIQHQQSLLKSSIRKITHEMPELFDANETFGNYGHESIKFSPSNIHKRSSQNRENSMSFLESQDKNQVVEMRNSVPQTRNSVYEDIIYCPKPKQQSLIEKRLRILQDYKELNGRGAQKEDSGYVPLYNNNLKSKNIESPSFRDCSPVDFKRQKHYENLPVYKERASIKVMSPLKSMIQNRENNEILPYAKSSYVGLETGKGGKSYEKDRQIIQKIETLYKKSRYQQHNQEGYSGSGAAKNLTRKYQYYFD